MPPARPIARALGAGRALLGLALVAAPDRVTEHWVGPGGQTDAGRALARGLGARDVVVGLGAVLGDGESVRPFIMAGVGADIGDIVAAGIDSGLPRGGRVGTVALAGASALLGAWLLRSLD